MTSMRLRDRYHSSKTSAAKEKILERQVSILTSPRPDIGVGVYEVVVNGNESDRKTVVFTSPKNVALKEKAKA